MDTYEVIITEEQYNRIIEIESGINQEINNLSSDLQSVNDRLDTLIGFEEYKEGYVLYDDNFYIVPEITYGQIMNSFLMFGLLSWIAFRDIFRVIKDVIKKRKA